MPRASNAGRSSSPASHLPGDDAAHMSRHLVGLSTAIRLRVREGLQAKGHDLTPSVTHLIPNLPVDGLGMSELAARVRQSLQRTGQLVQQLEEDGYVERVPDPSDGRAKRVVYTARGRALVADIDALMEETTARFAEVLGSKRFARWCRDLEWLDREINGDDGTVRVLSDS